MSCCVIKHFCGLESDVNRLDEPILITRPQPGQDINSMSLAAHNKLKDCATDVRRDIISMGSRFLSAAQRLG